MSRPAVLTPTARAEVRQALTWFMRDNPAAAQGFRDAVSQAARLIGAHPEIGRVRPELATARYRFWSLSGYPYVLVYEAAVQPPRIARIVHMARDLPTVLEDLPD